jgi:hypothetical protein
MRFPYDFGRIEAEREALARPYQPDREGTSPRNPWPRRIAEREVVLAACQSTLRRLKDQRLVTPDADLTAEIRDALAAVDEALVAVTDARLAADAWEIIENTRTARR